MFVYANVLECSPNVCLGQCAGVYLQCSPNVCLCEPTYKSVHPMFVQASVLECICSVHQMFVYANVLECSPMFVQASVLECICSVNPCLFSPGCWSVSAVFTHVYLGKHAGVYPQCSPMFIQASVLECIRSGDLTVLTNILAGNSFFSNV